MNYRLKYEELKTSKSKRSKNLSDLGLGKDFLDTTHKP